jgi:thiol-disulfide isomerase/thioredoxin
MVLVKYTFKQVIVNNVADKLVSQTYPNMMKSGRFIQIISILIVATMLHVSCSSSSDDGMIDEANPETSQVITAQGVSVPVFNNFIGFKPMLDYFNDTVYVVNFWATWCKPCVQELPYFNMADSAYADQPVRIILVSLDFTENVENTLIPFMIEKDIKPEVVVLDDMDANSWIPRVDAEWEGAIPATLFYRKHDRHFAVRSYTFEELSNQIDIFLKQ